MHVCPSSTYWVKKSPPRPARTSPCARPWPACSECGQQLLHGLVRRTSTTNKPSHHQYPPGLDLEMIKFRQRALALCMPLSTGEFKCPNFLSCTKHRLQSSTNG